MRKLIVALLFSSFAAAAAEERIQATTKEAEMMVHKAVEFVKKEGEAKALAVFNDSKGPFTYLDLYVFALDLDGKVVAHGKNPAFVGRNDTKDPKSKYGFAARVLEIGKGQGKGWLEYEIENPVSKKVERKVAYVERVGGLVISCGVFRPDKK
jgi:signal transduction histidine kinase